MKQDLTTSSLSDEFTNNLFKHLSLTTVALTAIILIGLQNHFIGWLLFAAGVLFTFLSEKFFRDDMMLVYFCVGILGFTPINTSTAYPHTIQMGIPLLLVVLTPYLISKYLYKNHLVRFPFHHGRKWYKSEIWYVIITAGIAYLLLPYMLRDTGSYLNWEIKPGFYNILESYVGLNVVGIWDELFFVSTVLGILRHHFDFRLANLAQAVLFTSFLYTLGFQGWSFIIIFIFALIQGYIFKKTESLLYILTIHLTFDLILHLTLIYLHHPSWMPIFIT